MYYKLVYFSLMVIAAEPSFIFFSSLFWDRIYNTIQKCPLKKYEFPVLSISHHLTSRLREEAFKLPALGQRFPNPPRNRPRLDYPPPQKNPKKTGNSIFQPEGLFDTRPKLFLPY